MTGGSIGAGDDPDRILITIDPHLDNMQVMPAALTLLPEPLFAARMEMHRASESMKPIINGMPSDTSVTTALISPLASYFGSSTSPVSRSLSIACA
jgi:hypothetical protein